MKDVIGVLKWKLFRPPYPLIRLCMWRASLRDDHYTHVQPPNVGSTSKTAEFTAVRSQINQVHIRRDWNIDPRGPLFLVVFSPNAHIRVSR